MKLNVLFISILFCVIDLQAQQRPIQLSKVYSGQYDYVITGNTFSTGEGNNECGSNTTAPATLTIPAGSTLVEARLYWAGSASSATQSDPNIDLNNVPVTATWTSTDQLNILLAISYYYACYADVTAIVNAQGVSGTTYDVQNMFANFGGTNCSRGSVFKNWSIMAIYTSPTLPYKDIRIYDGYVSTRSSTQSFTMPHLPVTGDRRISIVAHDSDHYLANDAFQINGTTVTNANNPANNFFNGTSNWTGENTPVSNPNHEQDFFDANSYIPINATSTSITMASGTDYVGLQLVVLDVNVTPFEICDNGLDDDADGMIDCVDSDCSADCPLVCPAFTVPCAIDWDNPSISTATKLTYNLTCGGRNIQVLLERTSGTIGLTTLAGVNGSGALQGAWLGTGSNSAVGTAENYKISYLENGVPLKVYNSNIGFWAINDNCDGDEDIRNFATNGASTLFDWKGEGGAPVSGGNCGANDGGNAPLYVTATNNVTGILDGSTSGTGSCCNDGGYMNVKSATGYTEITFRREIMSARPSNFSNGVILGGENFDVSTSDFCIGIKENCSNGGDDDGDGLVDCLDPECLFDNACLTPFACTSPTSFQPINWAEVNCMTNDLATADLQGAVGSTLSNIFIEKCDASGNPLTTKISVDLIDPTNTIGAQANMTYSGNQSTVAANGIDITQGSNTNSRDNKLCYNFSTPIPIQMMSVGIESFNNTNMQIEAFDANGNKVVLKATLSANTGSAGSLGATLNGQSPQSITVPATVNDTLLTFIGTNTTTGSLNYMIESYSPVAKYCVTWRSTSGDDITYKLSTCYQNCSQSACAYPQCETPAITNVVVVNPDCCAATSTGSIIVSAMSMDNINDLPATLSYQLKQGSNIIFSSLTGSFPLVSAGNYDVVVTNTNTGCTASTSVTVVACDTDGDGVADNIDLDDDNDGVTDIAENGFPNCVSGTLFYQKSTQIIAYNHLTGVETVYGTVPANISLNGIAINNDKGGLIYGHKTSPTSTVVVFDPATGLWTDVITVAGVDFNSGAGEYYNGVLYLGDVGARIIAITLSANGKVGISSTIFSSDFNGSSYNGNDWGDITIGTGCNGNPTLFGSMQNTSTPVANLFTIDLASASPTGNVGIPILGSPYAGQVAFNNGIMYGVTTGSVSTVNVCTGTLSATGQPGTSAAPPDFGSSAGSCINYTIDTDNDGFPNMCDLDSDDDGCSDAFESGATTNLTPNYSFPNNTVGLNGLASAVENNDTPAATTTYTSTYSTNALDSLVKSCCGSFNAGTDKIICFGTTTSMTATAGLGTWTWTALASNPGTASITDPSSATTTITSYSVSGTYNFKWSNGACMDTVKITVNGLPTVTCPVNLSKCLSDAAFALTGEAPTGGSYSGTGVNAGSFDPSVAGAGSHIITYLVTNANSCTNNCQFTIVVNPLPTITAGGPYGPVCEDGADITLTGSPSGGVWSGSGVTDGTGADGTFDPSGLSGSSPVTVTYSYTDPVTGCTNTAATASIVVNPLPTITAGGPYGPVCEDGADITLTGSPSGGVWSGSGVTDGTGADGTFDPSGLSGSSPVTVTYSYTDPVTGCTNTAATASIVVNPLPTLSVTMTECSPDFMTYTITFVSNGTVTSTAGTVSGNTVTGIPAGTNVTLTATNTTTGCDVTLPVTAPNCMCPMVAAPTSPVGDTICFGTANTAISATVPSGFTIDWYADASGGTPILSNSASYTPTVTAVGDYIYYAESREIASGCVSATRTAVNYKINPLPVITAGGPYGPVCEDGADITLTGSPSGGVWSGSGVTDGTGADGTFDPSGLSGSSPVTVTYSYTDPVTGCTNTAATASIVVNPLPTITAGGPYGPVCEDGADITLTGSPSGGVWSGSGVTDGTGADGTFDPSGLSGSSPVTVTYSYTDPVTGCTNTAATASIVVNPLPTITAGGPYGPVCEDGADITLTGSPSGGVWSGSGVTDGTGADGTFDPSGLSGSSPVTVTYSYTDPVTGCTNTAATASIVVNPLPTLSVTMTECSPDFMTYTITFVSNGTVTSTAGTVSGNTVTGIPAGTNVTLTATNTTTSCDVTLPVTAPNCMCPMVAAPTSPVGDTICFGTANTAISATVPSGFTIDWYADASGGTPILSNSASYTPTVTAVGDYIYYAESREIASGCVSATRTAVNYKINPLPVITAGGPYGPVCEDGADITLTGSPSGGVWSGSGVTDGTGADGTFDPSGLSGSSPVTVTYSYTDPVTGCTNTAATASIVVNPLPTITAGGPYGPVCEDGADITLTGSPSGGVWSGSGVTDGTGADGTFDPSGLSGSSPVTVTYSYTDPVTGCTNTAATASIVVNPLPTLSVTMTECSPDFMTYTITFVSNGTVTSTAGTVSGNTVTGIPAGTNVTLTATNTTTGCDVTLPVTAPNCMCPMVAAPTSPVGDTICFGTANTAISATVPSGFTIDWYADASGGTPILSNSASYTPTVTAVGDYIYYAESREIASGCVSATRTAVNYKINPLPVITAGGPYGPVCEDGADITLTGSPSGGVWSGSGVTDGTGADGTFDPSGLSGSSPVTVTYSYTDPVTGCTNTAATESIVVNPLPTITAGGPYGPVCEDSADITLTGSPSGGVWSGSGVTDGTGADGTFDPSGLSGSSPVTVTYSYTDPVTGCTNTAATASIVVNPLPTITAGGPYGPVCEDGADITLTGSPSGGVWSGSGVTDGTGADGTFDPSGLSGISPVTVTYSYTDPVTGCTNTAATASIVVYPLPTITAGGPYGPVCEDGAGITLTGSPSGGVWSGSGVTDGTGADGTFDPSGLSGSSPVTVTYSYTDPVTGCTNTAATASIVVNPLPTITEGGPYGPVCEDGADITLTGSPSGGVWSGSGVTDGTGADGTFDPSGLSGSSPVTVTYSYTDPVTGCTNTAATASIVMNPLPTITAGGPYGPVCEDGADITLTGSPSGGVWSGSGVTDGTGADGTFDPSGLSGSSPVTVTYSYTDPVTGCTNTAATASIVVNPLPLLSVTMVACAPDFMTYTITFTSNGTVTSTAGTVSSNTVTGIPAGTNVTLTATDATTSCDIDLPVTAPNCMCPMVAAPTAPVGDTICLGLMNTSVSATVPSGFTIDWYIDASGGTSILANSATYTPTVTTVGEYIYYAETREISSGCLSATRTAVNYKINGLPSSNAGGPYSPLCVGDTMTFNATSSGVAPLTYIWSATPTTGTIVNGNVEDAQFYSNTEDTYQIVFKVTDANGCMFSDTIDKAVYPLPTVSIDPISPICENGGIVTLTGNPTDSFGEFNDFLGISDNGDGTASFDPSVSGSGIFEVIYTYSNENGCVNADTIDITVVESPIITNVIGFNPTFCGVEDGRIVVEWTGGIPNIELSINNGATYFSPGNGITPDTFINLPGGTYNVIVRNQLPNLNCPNVYSVPVVLTIPSPINIVGTSTTNPITCGGTEGSIFINASGNPMKTLEYSIDNGLNWQLSGTFNGLSAGLYDQILVRYTDLSCFLNAPAVTLTDPDVPDIIDPILVTDVSDCGATDGKIKVLIQGGVPPLQISKDSGATFLVVFGSVYEYTDLDTGTYYIQVQGSSGTCKSPITQVHVGSPPRLVIDSIHVVNPSDCGADDGEIVVVTSGGDGDLQFILNGSTPQSSPIFTGLSSQDHIAIVSNSNGTCPDTMTVTMVDPLAPVLNSIATTPTTTCDFEDGTITVDAISGIPPLEYSIDNGNTWQSSNLFTSLAAMTYDVRVRNAGNTCVSSAQQILVERGVCTPDTLTVRSTCPTCPTPPVCATADDIVTSSTTTYGVCPLTPSTMGTLGSVVNGCVVFAPNGTQTDTVTTCIVACNNGICDTTYIIILPPPVPDTVTVTPPCPTCPTPPICATADDVTGTLTYSVCPPSPQGQGVLSGPDVNGCVVWTPNGLQTDTIFTCVVACDESGICDTTYIKIVPPPVPDTITVTPSCPTCPTPPLCVTADDLPVGAGAITYSTCPVMPSTMGTLTSPDPSGCVVWTPNSTQTSTVTTCVVACKNGVCDTTYIIILPPPVPDTLTVRPSCPTCPTDPICATADDLSPIGTRTYSLCALTPSTMGTLGSVVNGCVVFTPNGTQTDTVTTCIVACSNGVCDTTYIIILPPPVPDTVTVTPPCPTCPTPPICATADDVTGTLTYSVCPPSPQGQGVLSGPDVNGCVVWTPNGLQTDTIYTCVVACDESGICDTTYIKIVPPPVPDTITVTPSCPTCPTPPLCATADDLPVGAGAITYSTCPVMPSIMGTLTSPDPSGCVVWTPNGTQTSTVTTCVVACKNGVCDTTYIIILPPPVPDTVTVRPSCPTCPTDPICATADDISPIGTRTYSLCPLTPSTMGTLGSVVNGCVVFTPNGTQTDTVTTCIVACSNGVCDTTYIIILPPPVPDTVTVTPPCPTCPTPPICATADDVTGTLTYSACPPSPQGQGVLSGPDVNGCVVWTPNGLQTDTIYTCVVACDESGICDTTYIKIVPPPVPDTITVTPSCPTCPTPPLCVTADDLPVGAGAITYSTCPVMPSTMGILTSPDPSGCVVWTPNGTQTSTVTTCVVACKNGVCDTTYIIILPPPVPDTLTVRPSCPTCPTDPICATADDLSPIGTRTYSLCPLTPSTMGTLGSVVNGCVVFTPNGTQTDTVTTCIVACSNGVCDTTYIIILPPPVPDTVTVTPPCPTCPTPPICATADDVTGTLTYSACPPSPQGQGVLSGPDVNGCVVWTPNGLQTDTIYTCVVACDESGICDTTYIKIVPPPVPDTITVTPSCPTCPTPPLCVTADDLPVGAGAITYSTCPVMPSIMGTLTSPDPSGCVVWTPNGTQTSTVTTCVVACKNGVCDTTYIIILPPPVPDTLTVRPSCPTCPTDPICATADDLSPIGTRTYSLCPLTPSTMGTLGSVVNGCVVFTPNGTQTDTVTTCIVACSNGVCDTTYIIILPPPVPDTVTVTPPCPTCPTPPICATADDVTGTLTYSVCPPSPQGMGVLSGPDVNGCVVWTPNGLQTSNVTACVVACDESGICDTTYIIIIPAPKIEIVDPCNCADPLNYVNGGNYYFHEKVRVTSLAGLTFTIDALNSTNLYNNAGIALSGNPSLTQVSAGVYETDVWIRRGITYTINVNGSNGSIASTSNICNDNCNNTYASNDVNHTPVNTPVTGQVLTNDDDPQNHPQSVNTTPISLPAHGTVSISVNGTYTYTPNMGYVGEDQFSYQVCDNGILVACDTAIVTITIIDYLTPLNEVVGVDDNYTTEVNQPIVSNVITNDFDPEGHTMTVNATPVINPAHGIVFQSGNGQFTYIPNTGYVGTDSYKYQLCDNGSPQACDTVTVTIDIRPNDITNDTYANDDSGFGMINNNIVGNVMTNDNDPEGHTRMVTNTPLVNPMNGTVTLNANGTYTYVPMANFAGNDEFVYRICDNGMPQACDTATVYITILPEATCTSFATGQALCNYIMLNPTSPLALADCDGGGVPNNIECQNGGNPLDPEDDCMSADDPSFNMCAFVINNPTHALALADCDGGGVPNIFECQNNYNPFDPSDDCLSAGSPGFNICAFVTANPTHPLALADCDGGGISNIVECLRGDNPLLPGDDPNPNPDINVTYVNMILTGNVSTNDKDIPMGSTYGSPIAVSGNPSSALPIINADGSYSFISSVPGVYHFSVPITTPLGVVLPVDLEITVLDATVTTNKPVANTDIATTLMNTAVILNTLGNDAPGQFTVPLVPSSVTVISGSPFGMTTVNAANGNITFTPNAGFVGTATYVYSVTDVNGNTATAVQVVTILPPVAPNVTAAADDYKHTMFNTMANGSVLLNDTDPQGHSQTVTPQNVTIAGKGTLVLNSNGTYTFTPVNGFVGPVEYPYSVIDALGATASATLHILVAPPPNVMISGAMWEDLDGDGIQESGEPPIAFTGVNLYNASGVLIASSATNASGNYTFSAPPGQYYVQFFPTNDYMFTTPNVGNTATNSDVTNAFGYGTTSFFTTGNSNVTDIDAGVYKCIEIGTLVFYDTNQNDFRDPLENGINGLLVKLYRKVNNSWVIHSQTYTAAIPNTPSGDGYWYFCAPPGTYYVQITLPPTGLVPAVKDAQGFTPLTSPSETNFDSDINNATVTDQFTVTSGMKVLHIGGGFYPMATAGNLVWEDSNFNGLQDNGEPKIANVLVEAFDDQYQKVGQTYTNAEGVYKIEYLGKHNYFLKFTPPQGFGFTLANNGNELEDSDVDHSNGSNTTRLYSMAPGQNYVNIDAGIAFGALPVTWLEVKARYNGNHNVVSWKTGSEINSANFDVEKQNDKGEFIRLGSVKAAGNSNQIQAYSYNDKDVYEGQTSYYRIKQIDADGKFTYSDVVSVYIPVDEDQLKLYPNPATEFTKLTLSLSEQASVIVTMSDIKAATFNKTFVNQNFDKGYHEIKLPLNSIPAGVYNVNIKVNNVIHQKQLIVVE